MQENKDFRIVLILFGIVTTTIIFLNNRSNEMQEYASIFIYVIMLFAYSLIASSTARYYPQQRSSLVGLISKFDHSLEFLSPSLFWRVKSMGRTLSATCCRK